MARKLTVVVTCTERKSSKPHPARMVRNLPDVPIAERVGLWKRALSTGRDPVPLRDLYVGETWNQVKELGQTATRAGFEPTILVASAGLGLRSLDEAMSPYAATFSPGHADSISSSVTYKREWWRLLNVEEPRDFDSPSVIWVLSESYSQVLLEDVELSTRKAETLVFGGSRGVDPHHRIPADKGLRSALGGTVTSINVRTAIAYLKRLEGPSLTGEMNRTSWHRWATAARCPERYERQPLTDDQIREFVGAVKSSDPTVSATRALRHLRDAGMACEQGRFRDLFNQVGVMSRA